MIGGIEWLIVIAVIGGLIIFGGKKLPEYARSWGKAKVEFEKSKLESEKEIEEFKKNMSVDDSIKKNLI
jgi:sec-independent protein translocase protein TatA